MKNANAQLKHAYKSGWSPRKSVRVFPGQPSNQPRDLEDASQPSGARCEDLRTPGLLSPADLQPRRKADEHPPLTHVNLKVQNAETWAIQTLAYQVSSSARWRLLRACHRAAFAAYYPYPSLSTAVARGRCPIGPTQPVRLPSCRWHRESKAQWFIRPTGLSAVA